MLELSSLCRMCASNIADEHRSLSLLDSSQPHLQWAMEKLGMSFGDRELPTLVCLSCSADIHEWLLCETRIKKANIYLHSVVTEFKNHEMNLSTSVQSASQSQHIPLKTPIKTSHDLDEKSNLNSLITIYKLKDLRVDIKRLNEKIIERFASTTDLKKPNTYNSHGLVKDRFIGTLHSNLCYKRNPKSGMRSPSVLNSSQTKKVQSKKFKCKNTKTVCCLCGKVFPTRYARFLHNRYAHKNTKIFKCCKCHKITQSYTALQRHFTYCSKEFMLCQLCEYKTKRNYRLKCHISYKHEGGGYKCKYCSLKLCFTDSVIKHEKYAHSNLRRFMCDICKQTYKYKVSLKSHKKNIHHK